MLRSTLIAAAIVAMAAPAIAQNRPRNAGSGSLLLTASIFTAPTLPRLSSCSIMRVCDNKTRKAGGSFKWTWQDANKRKSTASNGWQREFEWSWFLLRGVPGMRTSPSIVPHDDDQDIYLVMDDFGGRLGLAWRETEPGSTDFETVIRDLLDGQYSNPVWVVGLIQLKAGRGMFPRMSPTNSAVDATLRGAICHRTCKSLSNGSRTAGS